MSFEYESFWAVLCQQSRPDSLRTNPSHQPEDVPCPVRALHRHRGRMVSERYGVVGALDLDLAWIRIEWFGGGLG